MKLREILSGMEILESNVDMDTEISGVSYDSRRTRPGDLFVAVVGFESDGHDYISAALEKGAAAVPCRAGRRRMRAYPTRGLDWRCVQSISLAIQPEI